eukprot:2372164-Amphidinium_carterae.1
MSVGTVRHRNAFSWTLNNAVALLTMHWHSQQCNAEDGILVHSWQQCRDWHFCAKLAFSAMLILIGCEMYYAVTDTVMTEGCGGWANSQTIKIDKFPPTSPLNRHGCMCVWSCAFVILVCATQKAQTLRDNILLCNAAQDFCKHGHMGDSAMPGKSRPTQSDLPANKLTNLPPRRPICCVAIAWNPCKPWKGRELTFAFVKGENNPPAHFGNRGPFDQGKSGRLIVNEIQNFPVLHLSSRIPAH